MATDLQSLLSAHFGFTSYKPGQERVIRALLGGKSALAVFPTGAGKSLCYQLPALEIEGLTLVVSPLIALMKDQIDFLQRHGVAAARLDSSVSSEEAMRVSQGIREGTIKLLYVAPERFNNERFVAEMKRTKIGLFAVDEAHCISEWGHNFRPDYLKLADMARELEVGRVLALTATATPSVVADICASFAIEQDAAVVTGFYRPNLTMFTTPTTPALRDALIGTRLKERPAGATIIYVTLQKTAERVAAFLHDGGLPARAYHAGLEPAEREEVQNWWSAADDGIVVATIAFGMGIDKAAVRYVYHYNLPKSLESYSQEIGRAGRDDLASTVEMLACSEDIPVLENFAYGDTPTEESIRSLVHDLLTGPEELAASFYDLANRYDTRMLVLRTAMTYLELEGVLHAGTPLYAGYEMKPLSPIPLIAKSFPGEHGAFAKSVFEVSKQGRIWFGLNPDEAAAKLGVERRRVVRALEVMSERGLIELRAADVRTPYRRNPGPHDEDALVQLLIGRFESREAQEIRRLSQVVDLIEHDGCQVNALVGYFGEQRDSPCGHCTWCLTKQRQRLSPPRLTNIDIDPKDILAIRDRSPEHLSNARQVARLLCGLGGPAFTKLRLTKEPLFGVLEHQRFSDVFAWCEGVLAGGGVVKS